MAQHIFPYKKIYTILFSRYAALETNVRMNADGKNTGSLSFARDRHMHSESFLWVCSWTKMYYIFRSFSTWMHWTAPQIQHMWCTGVLNQCMWNYCLAYPSVKPCGICSNIKCEVLKKILETIAEVGISMGNPSLCWNILLMYIK